MKALTTSTLALTLALGTAGMANSEAHMSEVGANSGIVSQENSQNLVTAEHIIGADLYTLNREYDDTEWTDTGYYTEVDTEWEEIGEISDVVFSRDGQLVGVIAEVGGWLDIGDEHVLIELRDLKMAGSQTGMGGFSDLAFVTRLSEEQLENMGEESGWW